MHWGRPKVMAILLQSRKNAMFASNILYCDPKLILQSNALHIYLGHSGNIPSPDSPSEEGFLNSCSEIRMKRRLELNKTPTYPLYRRQSLSLNKREAIQGSSLCSCSTTCTPFPNKVILSVVPKYALGEKTKEKK